ncbi:MAG: glucose 1-dehydrogenase [Alphaproteobacteria bacterium]|nr:glucose 1-dehydrogenase [Alphaproteobacteria bacterium]
MSHLFSLTGKTALVTGASSGLGHHFAKVLAGAGARVVVAARRRDKLDTLVQEITATGGEVIAVTMDVTAIDSIRAAYDQAEQYPGLVDIIVNNAGVADSTAFLEIDEASWDFTMDTNLKGVMRVAQEGCKRLIAANKPGVVINISSLLGMAFQTLQTSYATSKAAVIHLTRCMASELMRHNIRVNSIAPGYFKTEMNAGFFDTDRGKAYIKTIPARRLGRLEELDGPLLLLASEASSFINGTTLVVDGGHMVKSF